MSSRRSTLPNALILLSPDTDSKGPTQMAKPLTFDPSKFYSVVLSRAIEFPPGQYINPRPVVMRDGVPRQSGSVRLRGDICQQFTDSIVDAYEAQEG